MLVLLVYYVWIIPFRLCFEDTQTVDKTTCQKSYLMESKIHCMSVRGCKWQDEISSCEPSDRQMGLFLFDTVVDFFFLIDICLNFRTAYYITDERAAQVMIFDPKLIARNYVQSWFFFDIAGSLPLDLILYIIESSNADLLGSDVTRLPRILRIAKVLRFLKLVRAARIGKVIERVQEEVNIKPGVFRVVKFFFVFVMVAHLMACCLFWLGTYDSEFVCHEESQLCKADMVYNAATLQEGQPVVGVTWLTQTKIVSRFARRTSAFSFRATRKTDFWRASETKPLGLLQICRRSQCEGCPTRHPVLACILLGSDHDDNSRIWRHQALHSSELTDFLN